MERLVATTVAAPVLAPERALEAARGPITFWAAREPGGGGWVFAGWGEAARVEAQGDGRFDAAAQGATALLGRVDERPAAGAEGAPSLRLFGGFSFLPNAPLGHGDPPWGDFADASFALPAWLYATNGERAFLRAVLPQGAGDSMIDATRRSLDALAAATAWPGVAGGGRHVEALAPDAWRALVGAALACIEAGEVEKIVVAAPSLFEAERAIAIAPMLARLGERHPECARFAFQRGTAVFAGATPETLVRLRGRAVEADALAGSAPRRGGDAAAEARALWASAKDRREHAPVVEAIAAALGPLCQALERPAAPEVRTLRDVHHLFSPIRGTLARPAHVLALAARLHPTPAVCGAPRAAAARWIAAHEPAPRGWYAGAVGWIDAAGDGALSVALRAGLVAGRRAFLYAGAGIVAGSDPDAELAETRVKRLPMLAALGAAP